MTDRFPILGSEKRMRGAKRLTVPWSTVEPHAGQAYRNHGQTLERLATRGGLGWSELLAVLKDREWARMGENVAEAEVRMLVSDIQ